MVKSKDSGLKLSSVICLLWDFGEFFHLSKPEFPHLENWDSNSNFLKGVWLGLNEKITEMSFRRGIVPEI